MKEILDRQAGADVGGVGQTVAFTLASTPEAIRRHIAGLYSQGAKTVVRELVANAIDSHSAAGIADTVPIRVYLPTTFDPTFSVRDYGVGMSHEYVMELYSKIGHSSKGDSNNETGMFGIGSKSPLAISDTFTVRCYDKPGFAGAPHFHNGVDLNAIGRVRLYTVYYNEAGAPMISHTFNVAPRPEDEVVRGGVQVHVPITAAQRSLVLEGVSSQHFVWFDKNISFEGAFDEVSKRFYAAIVQVTPGLYFATTDKAQSSSWSVYVRQGAAVYPLDESSITGYLTSEIVKMLKTISENGKHVMFDIPLGTINVTPAREALRYEPHTTPKLAQFIIARCETFRAEIAKDVGDATSHRTALKRLAVKYLPAAERNSFMALKTISPFLSYVSKHIDDNYTKHYDALPDVPKSVTKIDSNGDVVRDPSTNAIVYEVKNVRPPRYAPGPQIRMSKSDFPEGKVILHTGKLYSTAYLKVRDSSADEVSFQVPNITYIIPNHLSKWQDRLSKHAAEKYADETLPSYESVGVPVYVIRCSKRNVDGVKAALEARAVSWTVYTSEDLPDIDTTVARQRNFSKTSVYQWDHKKGAWDENKLEPDYSKPAYYIARIGISHEVYTHHPDKPAGSSPGTTGFTLRPRLSSYDLAKAINAAIKLGILDATMPIYRTTENQAPKISLTVPDWKHLGTHLALEAEKTIRKDNRTAFVNSSLALSNDYYLSNFLRESLGGSKDDVRKKMFGFIKSLVANDPLFAAVAGTRCMFHDTLGSSSRLLGSAKTSDKDSQIREIATALFGSNPVQAETGEYNALAEAFQKRYDFFLRLFASSGSTRDTAIKHMGYYFDGFLSAIKAEVANASVDYKTKYPVLKEFIESFEQAVDKRENELYGTKI